MITNGKQRVRGLLGLVLALACAEGGGGEGGRGARGDFEVPPPRPIGEILQLQDDVAFVVAISELVFAREAAVGFERLTQPERVVFCLDALEREVNNGGFAQFFENSSGDHAMETVEALRTLGALGVAALVSQAVAVFPGGRPDPNRGRRQAQVERLSEGARARLDQLDGAFYDAPENLAALERRYVRSRSAEFLMP